MEERLRLNLVKAVVEHCEKKKRHKTDNVKVPKDIRRLLRKKLKLSKKVLKSDNWKDNIKVKDKIEKVDDELFIHYNSKRLKAENEAIDKIKNDPSHFFKYANKFKKNSNNINILKDGEKVVTNDVSKANILQAQYRSMWSNPSMDLKEQDIGEFFVEFIEYKRFISSKSSHHDHSKKDHKAKQIFQVKSR